MKKNINFPLLLFFLFPTFLLTQNCCDEDENITLCYISSADYCADNTGSCFGYSLDGVFMNNALQEKLLNPNNFGDNGLVDCEIELKKIQNISGTDYLNDCGCDLIFIPTIFIDPVTFELNSDATFFPTNELQFIFDWSKECDNNLVIIHQAEANLWGYVSENANVNPNTPLPGTTLSEIFDGPFGEVPFFNQGGGFQGVFTETANTGFEILAVDGNNRPTIVLDNATNDIILSDIGIFCANGAGQVSVGPNINNNNDILSCNIFALACTIASENSNEEITVGLCEGGSITLPDGAIITETGIYRDTFVSVFGCDSIITTTVIDGLQQQMIFTDSFLTICNGESIAIDNWLFSFPPSPNYTYDWSPNTNISCLNCQFPTVSPINDVFYTLTVTDSDGCTSLDSIGIEVIQPPTPVVVNCTAISQTEIQIDWQPDPAAGLLLFQVNVNGTGLVSPNCGLFAHCIDGLSPAEVVSIEVIGLHPCENTSTIITCETLPCDLPNLAIEQITSASCFFAADANLQVNLPNTTNIEYQLLGNTNTDGTFNNLLGGTYWVTATDPLGCVDSLLVEIPRPDSIPVSITIEQPIDCANNATGSLSVAVTNDQPPFTYIWNNNATITTITNLSTGFYTVTITNAQNCTSYASIFLPEPMALANEFISNPVNCFGETNGSSTAQPMGGTIPYDFSWSNGNALASNENLATGWQFLTITDGNDCSFRDSVFIESPAEIELNVAVEDATCFGANDGRVFVETFGGVPPYAYELSNNEDNYTINELLPAGFYVLTVLDNNQCVQQTELTINAPPEILITTNPTEEIFWGDSIDLFVETNLTNAEIDTIIWTSVSTLDCTDCLRPNAKPELTTTYQVTISREDGCQASALITVIVDRSTSIFVPNIFSPNDDGVNDLLTIFPNSRNINLIKNFSIYNRWGSLVFHAKDFSPYLDNRGWDGRFDGTIAGNGVFTYLIEVELLNQEIESIRGDVVLVR